MRSVVVVANQDRKKAKHGSKEECSRSPRYGQILVLLSFLLLLVQYVLFLQPHTTHGSVLASPLGHLFLLVLLFLWLWVVWLGKGVGEGRSEFGAKPIACMLPKYTPPGPTP